MGLTGQESGLFRGVLAREPLAVEGPVLDYAGDRARRLPSRDDARVCRWLMEDPDAFDGILSDPREPRGDDGPTEADRVGLAAWGDARQIANDFKKLLAGREGLTENERFMLEEAGIDSESLVLEVGCSCGQQSSKLLPANPRGIIGMDLNLFAVTLGAELYRARGWDDRIGWVCGDAVDLPFRDDAFTHLNCFGTLLLVPVLLGLRGFRRVLKPGGRLLITVEGMGCWQRYWDMAPKRSRRRLNLLRGLAGDRLMKHYPGWQTHPILRRLSSHSQFEPGVIEGLVDRSGFDVDRTAVLREYKGQPWIIALSARKRGDVGPRGR